jgi:hypothetical protein
MRRLLPLLLLLLTSCAIYTPYSYTQTAPTPYQAALPVACYPSLTSKPTYRLSAHDQVTVVGIYGSHYVVYVNKQHLLVSSNALVQDGPISAESTATPTREAYSSPASSPSGHDTYTGPRGGQYYYNGNGNKQYITPQSTIDRENVQTGPRGGQYYINSNGHKTYIKH